MKGDLHEEVSSLLDGKIEAAAGTVVGAQDQHHIFVADRAAQRFLVVYQRHGVNSVQPLDQTLRVILALIQSHKANHAPWKIICIRTAFKEYKAYGADLYKEALTMLAKGWEGDPDSLRSGILRGMVRFVALYQGEYDPERLVKRLHTVHPMTLVNDEKSLSGTVSYKYMMLILRTYNGASRRFNLPIKQ